MEVLRPEYPELGPSCQLLLLLLLLLLLYDPLPSKVHSPFPRSLLNPSPIYTHMLCQQHRHWRVLAVVESCDGDVAVAHD